MSERNNKSLEEQIDDLEREIRNLTITNHALNGDNLALTKKLEFARKHSDTIFCATCDKRCNREQIICAVCQVMNPAATSGRKKVFICSPLRGDGSKQAMRANLAKARSYAQQAFREGYAPSVPHLYYPIFLDDTDPEERAYGIQAGLEMLAEVAAAGGEFWICHDESGSDGMKKEILLANALGVTTRHRYDHPLAPESLEKQTPATLEKESTPGGQEPARAAHKQPEQKEAKSGSSKAPQGKEGTVDFKDKKAWAEAQIVKFAKAKDENAIKRISLWSKKNLEPKAHREVAKAADQALAAMSKAA